MATALVPAHLSADVEKTDPEVLKGAFAATAKLIESGESRLAIIDRMAASGIPNPVAVWAYSQVRDKGPDLELIIDRSHVYDKLDIERGREYWNRVNSIGWAKFLGGAALMALFGGLSPMGGDLGVFAIPLLLIPITAVILHFWGLADIAESRGYPRIYCLFSFLCSSIAVALFFTIVPKRHY